MSQGQVGDDEEGGEEEVSVELKGVRAEVGGGDESAGKKFALSLCAKGEERSTEGPHCSTPFPPLKISL